MTTYFEPISFDLWEKDKAGFASALGRAFRETGFAVISDHPVDTTLIARTLDATKEFFDLPADIKHKYFDPNGGGQRGYTPFGTENAKGESHVDLKEFWHTGRELAPGSPLSHIMPPTPSVSEVPGFNVATRDLYQSLDAFGQTILEGVARHLNLPSNWFSDKVEAGNSILRLLHYPAQSVPPEPGSMRAAAHEDINVITLLLGAEEAGLQVKHSSGVWLDINPPENAVVINCGDMLQRLTGGVLPSTSHRVLNPTPERAKFPRYSYPFFLHFNHDFVIEALPQCVKEGGTAEPAITAQEYLMERLREIGLIKP